MGNRMPLLKEQADKDAVKIVIMCAKNRRWSRLERANGNELYYVQTHASVGRLYTDSSKSEGCLPG